MKNSLYISAAVVAFAATAFQPAYAQASAGAADTAEAASGRADDIVVTARRRAERLQDVPLSVSAIGEQQLRAQGINNIQDIGSGRVPGFTLNSLFGVETAIGINIRGFGPGDASQGTNEQPVAMYIDGVPFARSQGLSLDLIQPERIEILRGPQGQLFGRNAEAGAVQIVSRRPSGVLGGEMTGGIGNFGAIVARGRIDLPEFGGFKLQLSGNFRRHGGYFNTPSNPNLQGVALSPGQNPQASYKFPVGNYDRDLNQLRTYGGRAAIEYDGGPFNAYYSFDYTKARDDQGATFFRNSPDGGTIFNPAGGTGPVSLVTASGTGGAFVTFQEPPLGSKVPKNYFYSLPWVPLYTKAYGHMLNLTYEASDQLTLKSITGSRYVRRQGANSLSAAVNAVVPSAYEYLRSRTFNQEFQAIYDTDRFDVTAGGIYFSEKVKDERESGFAANCVPSAAFAAFCTRNSQPTRPIYNFSLASAGFKRSLSETDVYGLYAQGTYTPAILDDRLDLIAGVRYSNDKKVGFRPVDFGLNPTTGVVALRNRFKTSRVDPAFSIKYKIDDNVNLFSRYAVGYRDGGSSVRSATFGAFDEDVIKSIEVGFKSELFDRHLKLNIAAFSNRITNEQIQLQSNPSLTPSLTDTFNSPVKKKIKGIEVEVTVRPVSGFSISANYAYLKVNNPIIGLDAVVVGTPPHAFVPGIASQSDVAGLTPDAATIAAHPNSTIIKLGPQGTPRHAGSIAVDWEHQLDMGLLAFHGDWVANTKMFVGAPAIYQTLIVNGVVNRQARYNSGITTSRFNASVALREIKLGSSSADLRLWVKNIFNHADGAFAFPAGNALSATAPRPNSIIYLQPPRTFGGELTFRF